MNISISMSNQALHSAVLNKVENLLSGLPFQEIRIRPLKKKSFLIEVLVQKNITSQMPLSQILQQNGFEDLRIVTEKGQVVYAALLKKYRIAL